ncbi:4-hydroxyphenylpyruvate dioxygenase-like isoform X1 [Lineus longissimus]|uniref:4-hydroxyphenylpyruvate dioxygenase-like isoform X1 n=1 Tax=Lineus longissimus TaxID=88925 RepID=UPI00315DAAE4
MTRPIAGHAACAEVLPQEQSILVHSSECHWTLRKDHHSCNRTMSADSGFCKHFGHVTFWVGNAKQAAAHYCARLGFKPLAYKGLETGSRKVVAHVVKQNEVVFVFQSPLEPDTPPEMTKFLSTHGDSPKDIAFEVDDVDAIFKRAQQHGAEIVQEPVNESDENGTVRYAVARTFGDITHTFVNRSAYRGLFMPGYTKPRDADPLADVLPAVGLKVVDHMAIACEMEKSAKWYEKILLFDESYTIDAKMMQTKRSSMKATAVANKERSIYVNLAEPVNVNDKGGPLMELMHYNGGVPAFSHFALLTDDIISTVTALRARGLPFMKAPKSYYVELREKLKTSDAKFKKDIDEIEKLQLLVDFDSEGYLIQTFTKMMQDRPTLVIEIIQRHNKTGFGEGNYKALYEASEAELADRGN